MINREYAAWPANLLPRLEESSVVITPPGGGPGYWAGAPSAVLTEQGIYLAYRLRRPQGSGRGYAVAVARSADGMRFETVATIRREWVQAESLERPCLVHTPAGRWRLYLSCATPGTKHWRVELLEAGDPSRFDVRERLVVLPGDAKTGVKDPVIRHRDGGWHLWTSCHPLADPGEADQMVTEYATSDDGLDWIWHGTALSGRSGRWDARGTRVSAVCYADTTAGATIAAFYDGRASVAENFEERTGIATGTEPAALAAIGTTAAGGPAGLGFGRRGCWLAVARLVLAGRPAADQPARPVFRLQPVAEVRLGDLLEQPDVVLDVGQHLLPLLPGQGLAGARAALQEPLERLGEGGARAARQVAPGGSGAPQHPGDGPVAGGVLRVGRHVLA